MKVGTTLNNMKYYNNNLAYDYEMFLPKEKRQEAFPENEAVQNKIVRVPEMSGAAGAARRRKEAVKSRLFAVVTTALLVAMLCTTIFLRVQVTETNTKINAVQSEIKALKSEETRLEMEIERIISYKNIEQAAIELGMQKKQKSQVTYINTGGESFAEVVGEKQGN